MRRRCPWLCLLLCAAAACTRQSAPPAKDADAPRSSGAAKPASSSNVVKISDEMMRDLRVTTAKVEQRRGGESANLLGELGVDENRYAEVGTPLQARVVALLAVQGQAVRAGQPLAKLQSGELSKARGDLSTAEARLELAKRALERKRGLNAERIVPTREVQEAENEAAAAEAQVRSALATLRAFGTAGRPSATDDASAFEVRAPISGVVLERLVMLGQVADATKPLFRIADLSTVWLTVHAFERDAVRLAAGAPARITFAAMPGRIFEGQIALIGRSVDVQSRTVPVRIDLHNKEGVLRPGMSATAVLPVGDQATPLLTVPAAALQRVRDGWVVFVPKDASTFEIRPVGRGRDLAGEVEIVTGLRAGDTIVVDGAFLLKAEVEKASETGEREEHK